MLPRLRFVIASIAIAILPMVFLGSGAVPAPPARAAFDNPRHGGTLPLDGRNITETQYRYRLQTMSFARRSTELSRLRELESLQLADWTAAPAGDAGATNDGMREPTADPSPAAESIGKAEPVAEAAPSESNATVGDAPAARATSESIPAPDIPAGNTQAENIQTVPPEDEPAANKPAADKTAADNPATPPTAVEVAMATENDPKVPDAQRTVAASSTLTQVVVVAPRTKHKKLRRVTHRRRTAPKPPAAPRTQQQQVPPGPFAFFSWLFGPHPSPSTTAAQPQFRAQVPPAAPISPVARTAAR